jgi:DNA recombination protein RmuC
MPMTVLLTLLIGLLACGAVWFVAQRPVPGYRVRADNADARARALEEQGVKFRARELSDATALTKAAVDLEAKSREASALAARLRSAEQANQTLHTDLSQARELLRSAQDRLDSQQSWVKEQGEILKNRFSELAGQLLAEKSSALQQHNNSSVGDVVEPLKKQIAGFQARIDAVREADERERAGLTQLLDRVGQTQQTLAGQTEALTRVLGATPGSSGALGVLRLELQLRAAGLEQGRHYVVEPKGEDQPALAIRLPDQQAYVPVDAGFSLAAWDEAAAQPGEPQREAALQRHTRALQKHVETLGGRAYGALAEGDEAAPYTLLYLPVEAAALAALQRDAGLLGRAHRHNVVLATPGTLFLTVGLVAQLWRVAAQQRRARAVAAESGLLLQRLEQFSEHFGRLGTALEGARQAYAEADAGLRSGDDNALSVGRRLRQLRDDSAG